MLRVLTLLIFSCLTLRAADSYFYCPTTNELVAIWIPPVNNRFVALLSGNATTNSYSRIFLYNTNSTATLDGKTVFKPTSQNGRWEEINVFDVASGFRIAGVAASNQFLKGNGTNFVSADLFDTVNEWTETQEFFNGVRFLPANDGDEVLSSYVGADPAQSISVRGDGVISWGSGSVAQDTALARIDVGVLSITNILNVTTGFRVNGGAISGNFLRGNGINFVNTTIQDSDLGSGSSITTKYLRGDRTWQTISGATPADLSVGTGVSITAGTGTGATLQAVTLAVNQAASFNWSGQHTSTVNPIVTTGSTTPGYRIFYPGGDADEKKWIMHGFNEQFVVGFEDDAETGSSPGFMVTRNGTAPVRTYLYGLTRLMGYAGPGAIGVEADEDITVMESPSQVTGSGTAYTITSSYARVDFGTTDAEVTLPSAGTYLVTALCAITATSVPGNCYGKLYNSTDAADVASSARHTFPQPLADTQLVLQNVITVAGSKVIQIYSTSATVGQTMTILAAETSISYVKITP